MDTRENNLRQSKRQLVDQDSSWQPSSDNAGLDISFGPAELLSNGQMLLVAVWASADAGRASDTQTLELALSRAMDAFVVEKVGHDAKVRWVNRTLLLSDDEVAPLDWMLGQTVRIMMPLCGDDGTSLGQTHSVISIGWGNSAAENFNQYGSFDKDQLVSGMVDAQVIWTEAEQLSGDSLQGLNTHAARLGFGGMVNEGDGDHKNLLMSLALHNVKYDELLLSIQGYRREIAQSCLDMWRYPELMKRISRQILEVARLEEERLAEQRTKYENLVSNVLLVVGLISAAQLVIAIIQTAFSGAVTGVPGGDTTGMMAYFRTTNIDLWIWGSLVSTISIFFVLSYLRRRVR